MDDEHHSSSPPLGEGGCGELESGKGEAVAADKVYDRQIRLWGIDAQKRVMESHILVIGLSPIHVEMTKNLCLAGFRLSVFDEAEVDAPHTAYNYFVRSEDIGQPRSVPFCRRISKMNPLAHVEVFRNVKLLEAVADVDKCDKQVLRNIFSPFTAVCIAHEFLPMSSMIKFDEYCRECEMALFVSVCSGEMGCFFSDMNNHIINTRPQRAHEESVANSSSVTAATSSAVNGEDVCIEGNGCAAEGEAMAGGSDARGEVASAVTIVFPSLRDALTSAKLSSFNLRKVDLALLAFLVVLRDETTNSDKIKDIIRSELNENITASEQCCAFADRIRGSHLLPFMPVASVLGGLLCQEVSKFATRHGQPLCNFVVFDSAMSSATFARCPPDDKLAK